MRPHAAGALAARSPAEAVGAEVEYVRHVYASTREWYTVAETKAQLLLAVNGAFVTILFSVLFGKNGDVRSGASRFGPETWIFLSVSVLALVSAIACAALCLWSLHGNAEKEFAHLGVDPGNPSSYRAEVLWYFGHLARLQPDAAVETLRRAGRQFEMQALSYNVGAHCAILNRARCCWSEFLHKGTVLTNRYPVRVTNALSCRNDAEPVSERVPGTVVVGRVSSWGFRRGAGTLVFGSRRRAGHLPVQCCDQAQ